MVHITVNKPNPKRAGYSDPKSPGISFLQRASINTQTLNICQRACLGLFSAANGTKSQTGQVINKKVYFGLWSDSRLRNCLWGKPSLMPSLIGPTASQVMVGIRFLNEFSGCPNRAGHKVQTQHFLFMPFGERSVAEASWPPRRGLGLLE